MVAQAKDLTDATAERAGLAEAGADATTLAELRKSVTEIAQELSRVAEARARGAQDFAQEGTAAVRSSIRRQPVIAVGVAALAGAALAVAVVPRGSRSRPSRWEAWAPSMPYVSHVTRSDLYEVADNLQRSMARSLNSVPMSSALERLADGLSRVDNNAGISSTIEKIGSWLQQKTPAAAAKK